MSVDVMKLIRRMRFGDWFFLPLAVLCLFIALLGPRRVLGTNLPILMAFGGYLILGACYVVFKTIKSTRASNKNVPLKSKEESKQTDPSSGEIYIPRHLDERPVKGWRRLDVDLPIEFYALVLVLVGFAIFQLIVGN
jgi:hypothetical protein